MNHLTIAIKNGAKETMMMDEAFATQYIQLRIKEGRLYSDEEVKQLPAISDGHPHYREWLIRKRSCKKLLRYTSKKNTGPDILEIGCGNGWLTAQMAAVTSGEVTGLDINHTEIEQARRIFGKISNCQFINGDIYSGSLGEQKFDMIIFAASIHYFKSLKDILNITLGHLTLQGEIHLIDSMFYQYMQIAGARERSNAYFNSMGFPDMANYYHHHFIDNLEVFQPNILYDPALWWSKFIYPVNPFHWIVIKNLYL